MFTIFVDVKVVYVVYLHAVVEPIFSKWGTKSGRRAFGKKLEKKNTTIHQSRVRSADSREGHHLRYFVGEPPTFNRALTTVAKGALLHMLSAMLF